MAKLEELLAFMRQHGLRITPQRRLIARHIIAKSGAVSAQELLERIHAEQPDVSLDTVYRNLSSLCDLGMLYRIDRAGKCSEYEFIAGRHVHYMVCTVCGEREVFSGCAVDVDVINQNMATGFLLTGHRLELYGLCPMCQDSKGE